MGPRSREVKDRDGREHDAEEAQHHEAAHAHVLDRHRDAHDRVGQGHDVRHEDEGEGEDDAQVQAVDDALGDDRARRRGHRDGPLAGASRSAGRVRIMYGRTISPMRNGMSRMAAKPTIDTAKRRAFGTSATPRSRKRQRVRCGTRLNPSERGEVAGQDPPADGAEVAALGHDLRPPLCSVNQMPSVMSRDARSLPLWRRRNSDPAGPIARGSGLLEAPVADPAAEPLRAERALHVHDAPPPSRTIPTRAARARGPGTTCGSRRAPARRGRPISSSGDELRARTRAGASGALRVRIVHARVDAELPRARGGCRGPCCCGGRCSLP